MVVPSARPSAGRFDSPERGRWPPNEEGIGPHPQQQCPSGFQLGTSHMSRPSVGSKQNVVMKKENEA